ncbi:helix-turn-helix domain-containing protein [Mycobacterium sp.]|uniref:helix-turn-helix domain-containing protein n=1 Tax=Mycobacterium sp. TaxID=1785 RepID=UPI002D14BED6|nr:helix-turn-helix domain-containing protein [Mycobacterium sp.]HTY34013.1 helix-turn-helix domain-containing protein [Mycobacterium sp.]HUO39006.1 helix-turn-helix domain-containing protein [Mycobacterium sp.]
MDYMFASDLEREFKLPESTWRFWHTTGKLPATKLGRRLVWRRADVLAFLASQGLEDAEPAKR